VCENGRRLLPASVRLAWVNQCVHGQWPIAELGNLASQASRSIACEGLVDAIIYLHGSSRRSVSCSCAQRDFPQRNTANCRITSPATMRMTVLRGRLEMINSGGTRMVYTTGLKACQVRFLRMRRFRFTNGSLGNRWML
jgi:hypothetical protein